MAMRRIPAGSFGGLFFTPGIDPDEENTDDNGMTKFAAFESYCRKQCWREVVQCEIVHA